MKSIFDDDNNDDEGEGGILVLTNILDALRHVRDSVDESNVETVFINSSIEKGTFCLPEGFTFDKTIFFEYESHKFFEMAVQIEGRSVLQLNDRYYGMSPGQIAVVNRSQVHRIGFKKRREDMPTMLWLNVTGDLVRSGCTTYSGGARNKTWGADLSIPGGFFLNEIIVEASSGKQDAETREAVAQYICSFLTLLYRKLSFETESMSLNWSREIVCELQDYIKNHLESSLRLQELSDVVFISPSYLSRIFRQVTGRTITSYIQSVKITKAMELLSDRDCSLCEIAEALGYYDQFHFSKVFKAYVGSSPTAYRNALSQQGGRTAAGNGAAKGILDFPADNVAAEIIH